MTDSRTPEQMPTAWRVQSFTRERGFGVLRHESGEEAIFSIDVWDLGGWKPSSKERAQGSSEGSVLMPQPNEAVSVQWKRSVSGKIVPARVQPTERISSMTQEYTLAAWLKGLQRLAGKFEGLTAAKLLEALEKHDEDAAEELRDGEPREASDYAWLLMQLGQLGEDDPDFFSAHAS